MIVSSLLFQGKYLFEVKFFRFSYFKAFECSFEVTDINADFLKGNYLFLRHFDDEKF